MAIFTIYKFGYNLSAGAGEDVWSAGGAYPFPASALDTVAVSRSGDDAAGGSGATVVRVSGLNASGVAISEDVVLDGTTEVPLVNNYLRVFRAAVQSAGAAETNAGDVLIKQGGVVLAEIPAKIGQTMMATFTVPAAYVSASFRTWSLDVTRGARCASVLAALQVRPPGRAWQTKAVRGVTTGARLDETFVQLNTPTNLQTDAMPGLSDIRVRILIASARNLKVTSSFTLNMNT